MDEAIVRQIFDELFSTLEPLEARSEALLEFVKAMGIAPEKEFAPYLERAGNASNVRWRAARLRASALISSALKPAEEPAVKAPEKPEQAAEEKRTQSAAEPAAPKKGKKEETGAKRGGSRGKCRGSC